MSPSLSPPQTTKKMVRISLRTSGLLRFLWRHRLTPSTLVSITTHRTRRCESTGPISTNLGSRMGLCVHSSSISNGWVCCFFPLVQFRRSDRYPEGSDGEQSGNTVPTPEDTTAPSVPPRPAAPTKTTISGTSHATQQPGRYKKRPFAYTEDNSDNSDNDVDMDNIEDNDSSGSSVDSNHVPAKHLRTSIATRSSRTTPAPTTTETGIHQSPLPAINDDPPALSNFDTECVPDSESEPECQIPDPADIDVDKSSNTESYNTTRIEADYIHEPADSLRADPLQLASPRADPPQPASPECEPISGSKSAIPDFLTAKQDIYGYLSSIGEAGYQDLLKTYITFELANHSPIRGTLTTARRPKGVTWWSGRARPNKLPPYDSLNSFTASITEWWVFIQPPWHRIEPGKVSHTDGDWERLYQPGINGLLNVVVLAYWWARILEEREALIDDTYSWFVSDVTWVLSRLTAAAHEGAY